jgi:Predicted membrane protein (DUF2142)
MIETARRRRRKQVPQPSPIRARKPVMRSVKLALAVALALTAAAIVVTLSRAPLTVAGTNSIRLVGSIAIHGDIGGCQESGTLPRGTTAIRLSLSAIVGPRVVLRVLSGGHTLTRGERAAGWGSQTTVTVPIGRVSHAVRGALVCTSLGPSVEPPSLENFRLDGALARPISEQARILQDVRMRMEYLRPGPRTWWSLASSVTRRMGLGHAAGGRWLAFLVLALMIAVAALASWSTLQEIAGRAASLQRRVRLRRVRLPAARSRLAAAAGQALRRVPRGAWACALIAFVNAACWSILTPPFQVPDEPSHFAYTQQLVENTRFPTSNEYTFSPEEKTVLADLHHSEVHGHPQRRPISSSQEEQQLQEDLGQRLGRSGEGGVGGSYSGPPLYYLLQTIPYGLASAGTLLDQLELMRLLSALMAGVTALFVFLFVREALPGTRWAWAVGGLAVALAPVLALMGGAVNPDSMLAAVSAAIFYCFARAFRRRLTRGLAVAIGALTAIGFLTKLNFVALAPGVIVGILLLTARVARADGRRAALTSGGIAVAVAVSPACVYVLASLLSGHPALGIVSESLRQGHGSLLDEVSYIWQFYLPRLSGMRNYFPDLSTAHQLWFDRSVGFYGWLDTSFPLWVDNVALVPAGLLALLCARSLIAARGTLWHRRAELGVYAVMCIGLLGLIAGTAYVNRTVEGGAGDAQPRYLIPLLPLLAGALVLAARGAGRRWGPAVGAVMVVLFLAHDIFSQLLVASRFYA